MTAVEAISDGLYFDTLGLPNSYIIFRSISQPSIPFSFRLGLIYNFILYRKVYDDAEGMQANIIAPTSPAQ